MTVLVGHDGRDGGRDALALGLALGRALHEDVLAVRVFTRLPPEIAYPTWERELEAQEAALNEEVAGRTDTGPVSARTIVAESAARTLHDLAESEPAMYSMVVVGSTPRGPVDRLLAGNTALRLLSGGPVPVAVAPRGFAGKERAQFASVMVGWVPSPESDAAVELAAKLAAEGNVELVSVVEPVSADNLIPVSASMSIAERLARFNEEQVAERRREAEERVGKLSGVSAEVRVLEGAPVDALTGASEDADLLVLGSRAYGPVRRVLLGGVSAKVLRGAGCPVLVVPRSTK